MHKPLNPQERLDQNRTYFQKLIQQIKPRAYVMNVKLVNNPFLKTEDKFQYIVYHLNEYNKRVQKKEVKDPYEMVSYQKLHSMISDLAQIQTREDQQQALSQIHEWYKQQDRLVEQRRDQGQIRYLMTNGYRKYVKISAKIDAITKQQHTQHKQIQIPSELVDRIMEPYFFGNRTSHKQLDIPIRRLNQYKRKVINIAPFIDNKEIAQPPRVLYPMPPKYQPKQEEQEPKQGEEGQQNKQGVPPTQGQPPVDGQQKKEEENQGQPEQDLGGFGQQPEQPEEQEPPEDTQDKLAPKNKLFTAAIGGIANEKSYKGQYMQFKGRQNLAQRTLEQRYLKLQEQILVKQRQDKINIELASERARKKSKMVKQIQKKLQDMMHKPNYKFSQEEAPNIERLSKEDELKFGFTTNLRLKQKSNSFDLANNTTLLPKIHDDSFHQKSIRRQRIQSLKSKFSKLLNLSEYEDRQTAASMCQYTGRRRNLSEIIKHHSKSKERLNQLDEVTKIKERLTRNKIGVNIRALSQGLCIPDSEINTSLPPENMFPNKQLPSNPFMVQTKKKKKKK